MKELEFLYKREQHLENLLKKYGRENYSDLRVELEAVCRESLSYTKERIRELNRELAISMIDISLEKEGLAYDIKWRD